MLGALLRVLMFQQATLPNNRLEECVNAIIEHHQDLNLMTFFLNFNEKFKDLKIATPHVMVTRASFPRLFRFAQAHFYVVIATNLDEVLSFFSRTTSWNPRAKFLIVQERYDGDVWNLIESYFITKASVLILDGDRVRIVAEANRSSVHDGCSWDATLFAERTNEKNSTMRVYCQQYAPFVIYKNSSFVEGLDGMLFRMVENVLNLTVVYEPSGSSTWGLLQLNGSYDGALGLLEQKRYDLLLGAFVADNKSILRFDATYPHIQDIYTWVVPIGQPLPSWSKTLNIFTKSVWMLIVVFVLIIAGVLRCVCAQSNLFTYLLISYRYLLGQSIARVPGFSRGKLVLGAWLFVSLIVASSFQGRLISSLTFVAWEKPLANSDEIVVKRFPFGFISENQRIFREDQRANNTSLYFLRHFIQCAHTDFCFRRVAYEKNMALLDLKKTIKYWMMMDRKKKPVVRFLDDRLRTMYFVMFLSKGHPMHPPIELVLRRLAEHGFVTYVLREFFKNDQSTKIGEKDVKTAVTLTLHEMAWIFWLHGWLLVGCCVCFALELVTKFFRDVV